MESVKQWAFSLCAAMVACGLARIVMPKGGMAKIFRTTVSVFFLCCLLSPVVLELPSLRIEIEESSQAGIEERARRLEAAVESQTGEAVRWEVAKIVGEKLDEMGIKYHDVTINMEQSGQSAAQVKSVEIILDLDHEKDHQTIRDTLERDLGLTVRLGYESARGEES